MKKGQQEALDSGDTAVANRLVARLDPALVPRLPFLRDLDITLARARALWPGVHFDLDLMADYLARLAERLTGADAVQPEVFLAAACDAGDGSALEQIDELLRTEATRLARRMGLDADARAELVQAVREKLLVRRESHEPQAAGVRDSSADGRARITQYAGVGRLSRWLRAALTRTALNMSRTLRREVLDDTPCLERESALDDPELCLLRQRYGADFTAAFRAALSQLPARARTLLRCKHVDGMTLEELARLCHAGRSTVAKWLQEARGLVLTATKRELARNCQLTPSQVSSILRFLRQSFDESMIEALDEALTQV